MIWCSWDTVIAVVVHLWVDHHEADECTDQQDAVFNMSYLRIPLGLFNPLVAFLGRLSPIEILPVMWSGPFIEIINWSGSFGRRRPILSHVLLIELCLSIVLWVVSRWGFIIDGLALLHHSLVVSSPGFIASQDLVTERTKSVNRFNQKSQFSNERLCDFPELLGRKVAAFILVRVILHRQLVVGLLNIRLRSLGRQTQYWI